MEVGQGLGLEVDRGDGLGDEVLFGGVHGADCPERAVVRGYVGFASLDECVAGDGDSVFEGEEFAVAHGYCSLDVSWIGVLGLLSFPVASIAVTW